jgi:Zn-dependent protease with chaperone function
MISTRARSRIVTVCLATLMALSAGVVCAQTRIKPGFNLFSVEQDQEIGRQSADEVERQLPIINDRSIEKYVNAIGSRLAAVAPGANYQYQFKVVNASDINAFALPGGYMYLDRGLIEAARNEGQLAGVMAHEMAHIALRHGTNQASKAYLGQTGLGLLGGLIGKDDRSTEKTIAAVGGFGLNTLFLKFSRTAEEQADVVGAQMMAEAGYDPADMLDFFNMLADTQDHDPSKVEQFFSSHPAPVNRAARITDEMEMLTIRPTQAVGGFTAVRSELLGMRPAASMQQIAQGQGPTPAVPQSTSVDRSVVGINIDRPSSTFRVFEQPAGLYRIGYPDNWRIYEAYQGYGVILAPDGGFLDTGGAERDLISGVIVNRYDPFNEDAGDRFLDSSGASNSRTSLAQATNDLIGQILRTNPNLQLMRDSERRDVIDGEPSLSVVLYGRSPATREEERVTLFSREISNDQIIYALFIAPRQDYDALNETFNRMISSLRVNDEATPLSSAGQGSSSQYSGSNGPLTVPSGTMLAVEFQQTLSSADSKSGDRFTARVVEPVMVDGKVAIAKGSIISGQVMAVQPSKSKKFGGRAQLNLEFTSLQVASGGKSPISASFLGQGKSQKKKDAVTIGGAAVGGAIIGRIIGKDTKGAVLGGLVGGAIGTGIAAKNHGQEVTLPEGMTIAIQLDSPFEV